MFEKVLIDEDPNRQYWQLQEMMEHKLNIRLSTAQIGIAVITSVKEQELRRRRGELHRFLRCVHDLQLKSVILT